MALIATDVAARGIDVEGINCVIHYDPPENGKAYKHRSGRTARGGSTGIVISLIQKPQRKTVSKIQREVGINVEFTPPDFGDLPEFEVEFIGASRRRSFGSQNRNQTKRGHYGKRNRSGGRSNRSDRKSGSRTQERPNRNYNKKKPRNTHLRPNRGKKTTNEKPTQPSRGRRNNRNNRGNRSRGRNRR